jgi:hypothetical protein
VLIKKLRSGQRGQVPLNLVVRCQMEFQRFISDAVASDGGTISCRALLGDDGDQSASLTGNAYPRRSTQTLGAIVRAAALTAIFGRLLIM